MRDSTTETTGCHNRFIGLPAIMLAVCLLAASTPLAVLTGCSGDSNQNTNSSATGEDNVEGGEGSSGSNGEGSGQDAGFGNPPVATIVVEAESVDAINQQLEITMGALPPGAKQQSCVIMGEELGQVEFSYEGLVYAHRGQQTSESTDISGMSTTYQSSADTILSQKSCFVAFTAEAEGIVCWYDGTNRVSYSLSMDTGATWDKLTQVAALIIATQKIS